MLQINLNEGVNYINEGALQIVDIDQEAKKLILYFCNGNENVIYNTDDFSEAEKVLNFFRGMIMPVNWIKSSTPNRTVAVNSALLDFASFNNSDMGIDKNFVSFIGGDLLNASDFDGVIGQNLVEKIKQFFQNHRPLIIL